MNGRAPLLACTTRQKRQGCGRKTDPMITKFKRILLSHPPLFALRLRVRYAQSERINMCSRDQGRYSTVRPERSCASGEVEGLATGEKKLKVEEGGTYGTQSAILQ